VNDTTIKVEAAIRDRLAEIARERGTTIRDLVSEFAKATQTRAEIDIRYAEAVSYIREHMTPDLSDADLAAGETFWQDAEAGRPLAL
jgi:predicted DNA-binding ribbon-helix-helix protein